MTWHLEESRQFVPKAGIAERKSIRIQRGSQHRGLVHVVAIIQQSMKPVLRPCGTRTAFLQIIQEQQWRCADFLEASVKGNIRIGMKGLTQVIEQGGYFHQQRLPAQGNAIVANRRRKMSLPTKRSSQKDQPAMRLL